MRLFGFDIKRADVAPTGGNQAQSQRTQNTFYGPGEGIPPIAPASTLPRLYDYAWNANINFAKRKYENVSFEEMRTLARENYLIRIILEKAKARICNQRWEFRLRAQNGEHLAEVRERSASDPRIAKLYAMFERPDGEHDWPEWLNALLEDRFVIDAATLWVERDRKGEIQHFVPVDGSTINRLIDGSGMTPKPPYAAYQQLVKGFPAINFTQADLAYMPSNFRSNKLFGYSEIEQTIRISETQINRAIWTLNHYTEGNIPELLVMFKNSDYTAQQIEEFLQSSEASLNGQLDQRQRMYPLPDATVHEVRGKELMEAFDEWMARVFCYQMGEPPTAFVKMINRATSEQLDDTREEIGERTFVNWVRTKLNRLIQHPYYLGWDDIEAAPAPDAEVDPLKQAQVWQIEVPLGITTAAEARVAQGKTPTPDEDEPEDDDDEGQPQKAHGVKKKSPRRTGELSFSGFGDDLRY